MADFNSSFLNHLKQTEKERDQEFMKVNSVKRKPFVYPGEKLLRKYKRKIWCIRPHRKKIRKIHKEDMISSPKYQSRYSWPIGNVAKCVLNKRHSFDSAVLPDISHCKDFPISEIGTELSGNRNNGNSPFNSSNSCGSPPDSRLLCKADKTSATRSYNSLCQKCSMGDSEQNNNTNIMCTCITENLNHGNVEMSTENLDRGDVEMSTENLDHGDVEMSTEKLDHGDVKMTIRIVDMCLNSEKNDEYTDSEKEDTEKSSESETGTNGETYIDVESLDESGEGRGCENTVLSSDKVMEVFENGLIDQPVQYVGSNVKHSQPSKQIHPVKWQQQFMSFLSSTTASEEDLEDAKHHHSPRRKRSRKSRKSKCPCCIGSGEHHKKREKSEGSVKYHKSHSMMRDHRRFIRDMSQLVSLRNKVMTVCKVLFPQCVNNVFNYANPDSEDVDKCLDQMISILHNAHQQFLHNFNSKSEISRSANSHKKFKSESQEKLKYVQLNSNEILVSVCDQSKPEKDVTEPIHTTNYISSDENLQHPSILFCPQSDKMNGSREENRPTIFPSFCLQGNGESIVYAIPVENGIAYPDQTQVLLTGGTQPSLVSECPSGNGHKEKHENDHTRILSEADSGIVHDVSSPEDAEKIVIYQDRSLLWSDTKDQSKPNTVKTEQTTDSVKTEQTTDSAKTEQTTDSATEQTDNIFDLFSNYQPAKLEGNDHDFNNINSSREDKKPEIKTGDRNIFDSLFSMNIESSVSPPKCVEKNDKFDQICDKEIESFYFQLDTHETGNLCSISPTRDKTKAIFIEVYDPAIRLCKKPKICLKAFKEKITVLLRWLLPEIAFEKNFFKNTDNLEYVLDALLLSNEKETKLL